MSALRLHLQQLCLAGFLCCWAAGSAAAGASATAEGLYALVAERLAQMEAVAAFKWLNERPVEDVEREAVVIRAALDAARDRGIQAEGAETFFRVQIEAAKDIQRYWFGRWSDGEGPADAPDLATEIRPRLLVLGEQITDRLGLAVAHDYDTFAEIVATEGLEEARVRALYQALTGVIRFESRLAQIQATGVLRVGTTGDYAPFSYEDEASDAEVERDPESWAASLRGADVDMARDLAAALGVTLTLVRTSWPTLSQDLQDGRFDVAMSGVSRTLERARIGALSMPYYYGGKMPIARCEDRERFGTLAGIDQPDVRVIVNPGGTNERFVDERLEHAEKVLHPDNRTIFSALLAGQADVMVTDSIEVALQARKNPGLCGTMAEMLTYQEKAYFMPADPALARFVDTWLSLRLSDGTLTRTLDSHLY